jgi:hypothetical protein
MDSRPTSSERPAAAVIGLRPKAMGAAGKRQRQPESRVARLRPDGGGETHPAGGAARPEQ